MLDIGDIKIGKNIIFNNNPYKVLYTEHSKTGRAGAVLRTKLKNLATGAVLERTFQGAEKADEADIFSSKAQYLYLEGNNYYFMDSDNFDQFSLSRDVLGEAKNYLIEGTEVAILNFNGIPINLEVPIKVKLKVTEAPPGIKGDSVSSGGKLVTLETGLKINAPLFVKEGDILIVNTERGEYVSRG
ncbi:MAG: elongation factor P [bacterium]|nr:elongation factor P [bacterium]